MALDLKAPADAAKQLNERAATEYCAAVERYADALLKEASRLEAANKSTSGEPEITSTMVKDADILLRRAYTRRARSSAVVTAQLVATVGGFLTGLLADMDKLRNVNTLAFFVIVLTVTIAAAVVSLVKD